MTETRNTARKYRKRHVMVEAVQWDGEPDTAGNFMGFQPIDHFKWEYVSVNSIIIETLEGTMRCDKGDWIVEGIQGEFYPVKSDIFEATYEAVDE